MLALEERTAVYRQNTKTDLFRKWNEDECLNNNHQSNAKNACDDFRSRTPFCDDDFMELKLSCVFLIIYISIMDSYIFVSCNLCACLQALLDGNT